MKILNKSLAPALIVPLLVAVFFSIKNDIFKTITQSSGDSSTDNSSANDKNTISPSLKQLSILGDRCRGCGKCVRIDPEHFELNGRQAKVISSSNLDSSDLQLAINNCRDQAISLN